MLARLAIDPEALADTITPMSMAKFHHNSLLETIAAHGSLLFANNGEARAFVQAIKNLGALPPGMAEKWSTVLSELHKLGRVRLIAPPGDRPISQVRALDALQNGWKGNLDIAVLGHTGASAIGISDDEGILEDVDSQVELATVVATPHTRTVTHFRELADIALLPASAKRETFWDQVLRPISTMSKAATILDGYLMTSLWGKEDNLPRSRSWQVEHVEWILDHLDTTMMTGAELELICAYDPRKPHYTADESADAIRDFWRPISRGRFAKVTLTLVERQKGFTHDRHIRFSTGVAITIAAGFDRLRAPQVWDEDGMAWNYKWRPDAVKGLRDREERAKSFRPCKTVTVLER
jgi:hypothetical protein